MFATPFFRHDHDTRRQLREARTLLLDTLATDPDNLIALILADVVGELDTERDAALATHRMRFRATRAADWELQARTRGVDRMLFHLAQGLGRRTGGHEAAAAFERRAVAISEARAAGVPAGLIDAAVVPPALANDRRVKQAFHPSGHLRRVAVALGRRCEGELALTAVPGEARFTITQVLGGYGAHTREAYRDGRVFAEVFSPWHDGAESSYAAPWTKWVMASLDALASLVENAPRARGSRRARPRRR